MVILFLIYKLCNKIFMFWNYLIKCYCFWNSILTKSNYRLCRVGKLMIQPTLYPGSGPVPRRSCAKDEWSKAEVSRGTVEDDPILGTSRLQRGEQRLDKFYPQIASWRGCEWNGAHVEVWCKIASRKIRPLRIKCTRQHPDHVNEKRRLGGVNFDHRN